MRNILITISGLLLILLVTSSNAMSGEKDKNVTMSKSCCDKDIAASRTYELSYEFTVNNLAQDQDNAFAWIPMPPSNDKQTLVDYRINGNHEYEILTDEEYGNKYIKFNISDKVDPVINVVYTVKRNAFYPLNSGKTGSRENVSGSLKRFLQPDSMIPLDGDLAAEAKRVASAGRDNFHKARLLYDNIVKTVAYDKTGEGWGRGDAVYACDIRKGNCTDFHSLFIGEARSLGIPARFTMGFSIADESEGSISGYHCWAEFYDSKMGWLPVDASEAYKHPEKHEMFFGGLDENRIGMTLGRDIKLPESNADPLNYSLFPHVEVDGQTHDDVTRNISFREIKS